MSVSRIRTCIILLNLSVGLACAAPAPAKTLRLGVLTDMSGPYADIDGQGSVEATRLAVTDAQAELAGRAVEVISADHGNDPDRAAGVSRDWYAQGVSAIFDLASSGAAMAAQQVANEQHQIMIVTGAGASDLTGALCGPTAFHWVYDTDALARSAVVAALEQGKSTWFFITADYASGHALERDATDRIKRAGGRVLGHALHPLGETDFSRALLAAKASGAAVVALANAGRDTARTIEQAAAYHLAPDQQVLALLLFSTDIHDIGLDLAQDLTITTAWYWDRTPESRDLSARFAQVMGRPPTMVQAGVYSAVRHYLHAVADLGTDDPNRVAARMRTTPVHDAFVEDGQVRADGLMVHALYAARVVTPGESHGPWDYLRITRTIPGDQAFRPLAESSCPLVHGG